jgi:hypothetical protein
MGGGEVELRSQIEKSEDPRAWADIIARVSFQAFYRQLGMVSLPIGITVASQAIDILCKERNMGEWGWLLEDRVLLWKEIPIDSAVRYHAYVYGSPFRNKNSVFTRVGWWRMYFVEAALKAFDASMLGRTLVEVTRRGHQRG